MRRACCCSCHNGAAGEYRYALQLGAWPKIQETLKNPKLNVTPSVSTFDAIEAAAACPLCLAFHVDALSIRAIWGESHERSEWVDPPPRKPDEGEGAE